MPEKGGSDVSVICVVPGIGEGGTIQAIAERIKAASTALQLILLIFARVLIRKEGQIGY